MQALVRAALLISIGLLVLSLGLRSSASAALYLFRRPALLGRAVLAMNVLMPLLVLLLVGWLALRPAVEVALLGLAMSPVAPFLPVRELRSGARADYVFGLLIASAVVSIVLVPATNLIVSAIFGTARYVGFLPVFRLMVVSIVVPFGAGVLLRRLGRVPWNSVAAVLNMTGMALLVLALIPVLITSGPAFRALIGDGTLLVIVVVTALGLLIGHLLGGPNSEDRLALALATTTRHPAVAIAVAAASAPRQTLAPAAILLAVLVNIVAVTPYLSWRKRVRSTSTRGHDTPSIGARQ